MGRLEGRTVLISGAARGQGAAEAQLCAREGASVVLGDILDASSVADVIRSGGGRAEATTLDVTDRESWNAAVALAVGSFGQLDGLVNNAGITAYAGAADCTDDEWTRVTAVNQTGVFYGMRAAIPALRDSGGGAIVNTASIFGLQGADDYFAYIASKAAVIGMTKSAALSYAGDGIRVNAVAPGTIETPMLEQELADHGGDFGDDLLGAQAIRRLGQPDDIAYAVLYLLSEEASFVTGEVLVVDGGYSAR
jgi:NAD(P)-dependent dehydrogenase (short-subunit alcohol dehydrogenase family)